MTGRNIAIAFGVLVVVGLVIGFLVARYGTGVFGAVVPDALRAAARERDPVTGRPWQTVTEFNAEQLAAVDAQHAVRA